MAVLDLFLPPSCAGCGRYGSPLCAACLAKLRPASRPGDRFFATDAGTVLGDALLLARAAFAYEGVMRRALQRLKYGGASRLAAPLATAALPALRSLLAITGPLPLVAVPLHTERLRARGYNQAALLANALARSARLPRAELLVRHRSTTKQHRLDRAGRLHNLKGAFAMASPARPPPAVIVVDDILTTSATLEACASVLKAAGCERVYGFALAREL